MLMHSAKYRYGPVHGILVGKSQTEITDVLPVCHSLPTKPFLEVALSLASEHTQESLVGWYTSNDSNLPDPVCYSAASAIQSSLVVVLQFENSSNPVFAIYNGSKQSQSIECEVAPKALTNSSKLFDFEDHVDGEVSTIAERDWLTNKNAVSAMT